MSKLKIIGIYKITSPSGKVYIGQSTDIHHRWMWYRKLRCKRQTRLYHSFMKYGVDKHIFEIVTECNFEELNDLERYYQETFSCIDRNTGLNCRLVDTSTQKAVASQETRDRIGDAHRGKKMSLEAVEKMRLAKIGVKQSLETREKKRIYMTGKKMPIEGVLKSIQKRLGRKNSPETIERMKISQRNSMTPQRRQNISNGQKGRVTSEETKKKLSEIGKNYSVEHLKGQIPPNAKIVINLENGIFYNSISEAAQTTKYGAGYVHEQLTGRKRNRTSFMIC